MTLPKSFHHLLKTTRDWVAQEGPHVASFVGDALGADFEENPTVRRSLPALDAFVQNLPEAERDTQPLLRAIVDAGPDAHWQQSYSLSDPGIDQAYLDAYGWFNLVAPSGPFVSNELRVSVGYWGQGLHYPMHSHAPEEIYLTVAGRCTYLTEGRAPLDGGPGTTVCHSSFKRHGFRNPDASVLVMAFWRGEGLEARSHIGDAA